MDLKSKQVGLLLAGAFVALILLYHFATRPNQPNAENPGTNTAESSTLPPAQQQLIFSSPQFTRPIVIRIPADDYFSAQKLIAQTGPVEWWSFLRDQIGCVQSGYAANAGSRPLPSVDGYNLAGSQLENNLEQSGARAIETYNLTLNPTPWGAIQRSFACVVNKPRMARFTAGQDFHSDLAIPIGQQVCDRWTYVNRYQTTGPGQGPLQVFAGTFSYTMKPLADGVHFSGQGTAQVKMVLNPDNGQWSVMDFQLHDPNISISGFSAPQPASSPQDSCPGP